MTKTTLQTLIPKLPQNELGVAYLSEFGALFGSATRLSFKTRNHMGITKSKGDALRSTIASTIETRYGLSNTEAKNAALLGIANYDSQAELVNLYIDESEEKIKSIRKSIRKQEALLKKAAKVNNIIRVCRLKHTLHLKNNAIVSHEARIARLKQSREIGKFSVCFGTKKLFSKQHRLEENKSANHTSWLADWRESRNSIVFYEGSTNFKGGNQLVRYDAPSQTLALTVSPALRHKYGESVTLCGVQFAHGGDLLQDAISPVKKTSTRFNKQGEKVETSRWGTLQPVTYRFVLRENRVYLYATIDQPTKALTTSTQNGALGIDFNPNSINWSLIDRHGNLKRHGSIKINIQDKRSNQTKDILGKAIAQIIRIAEQYSVPIIIEDLDFAKKKSALRELKTKSARMLSNFAYSQFISGIETRCSKCGIELLKVDAAYTSVIGVTKYMAIYSLNSGCAAALVIARRGQGRNEKLPKAHARYFKKPEDCLKSGAWRRVAKRINIRGRRSRHAWYSLGQKQVRTNCPMHSKPRQTLRPQRRRSTVQVLRTPHIRQKPCASGSLGIHT